MKILVLFFTLSITTSIISFGQDFHYSQYDQAPLILNPALTGNFNQKLRIGLNYRDQWSHFEAPYKTISAYSDGKILYKKIKDEGCATRTDFFGVGTYFYSDKVGDGNLSNTNFMLLLSYIKKLSKSLTGGVGFGFGIGNKKIELENLHFLSQWNGSNFNSNLPQDLDGKGNSFNYFDINAGLFLIDSIANKMIIMLGFSLNHINKPNNGFLSNEFPIPMKINIHGGFDWGNEKWKYNTSFLYSKQERFNEIVIGFKTILHSPGRNIELDESKIEKYNKGLKATNFNLIGGLGVRLSPVRDIIPAVGIELKGFKLMISYDANLMNKYIRSPYNGGFEISFSYRINRFN